MSMPAPARRISVDPAVLDDILSPYRPHCRYLKRVTVELPPPDAEDAPVAWARGEFEIPASWYIDDTGHFNSIEFNLCYNQLVYTLIGQCVRDGLVPELATMDYEEYRRRQLPDVLIVRMTSAFKKAMDARSFRGVVSIERIGDRKSMLMLRTACEFEDADGGFSSGEITLAIVDSGVEQDARPASWEAAQTGS